MILLLPILSVVQVSTNDSSLMCLKMILGALGINFVFNTSITIRNLHNWIKRRKNKVQQEFPTVITMENMSKVKNRIEFDKNF